MLSQQEACGEWLSDGGADALIVLIFVIIVPVDCVNHSSAETDTPFIVPPIVAGMFMNYTYKEPVVTRIHCPVKCGYIIQFQYRLFEFIFFTFSYNQSMSN